MPEVITDNIDLWTSALLTKSSAGRGSNGKLEAYGIKKLRELILELAVRGKLMPQDTNDEPASVLLKYIADEKAQLIKEKRTRKQEILPAIDEFDEPHELPVGWEWARLGDICTKLTDGSHNPPSDAGEGHPMLSSQNVFDGKIDFQNPSRFVSEGDFEKENQRTQIMPNDVLLTIVASLGRSAVVPDNAPMFVLQRSVAVLQSRLAPRFFSLQLVSPHCLRYYDVNAKGTAQKGIYLGKLALMGIAVPPLAEQHRIVAKVDELMALCDQLEQQQTHCLEAHQTLVASLLGTLTRVESQQEFSAAWARIASHFDTLFATEASIDQLKQTILQLAVMGKLVPQDPNDEDVQVLLTRNDLRRREVAASDRRADAESQKVLSSDDRWGIPDSWDWRGLADLVLFVDYRGKTPTKQSSGIRLLTAKNVRKGQIDLIPEEFLTEQEYKDWMTRGFPKVGDVLFTTEAPMGNAAVIELTEQFALAQRVICFQNYGALDPAFLVMQMLSAQFQYILDKNGTGMTAKGIKASKLKQLPIAIPPLAEQRRIVAKVDELMALCDALKARLAEAQATQLHLADAIVEQAVC